MNFRYGNRDVTANLTLSTWNPSQPTTFYQLGSQGFVNNAFLTYNVAAVRQAAAARRRSATSSTTTETWASTRPASTRCRTSAASRGVGGLLLGRIPADAGAVAPRRRRLHGQPQRPLARRASRPPTRTTTSIRCSARVVRPAPARRPHPQDRRHAEGARCTGWSTSRRTTARNTTSTATRCRTTWSRAASTSRTSPTARISVFGFDAVMIHPVCGLLAIGGSHIDAHERLPAARPADVRRRGARADRALAGRRHRRHRPGRRRRHQLQRQPGPDPRLAASRSTPTARTC